MSMRMSRTYWALWTFDLHRFTIACAPPPQWVFWEVGIGARSWQVWPWVRYDGRWMTYNWNPWWGEKWAAVNQRNQEQRDELRRLLPS